MELKEILLEGRRCLFRICENAPTVLIGTSSPAENLIREIPLNSEKTDGMTFGVFFYEIQNWNRDLSPWQAETGIGSFEGMAGETLEWLGNSAAAFLNRMQSGPLILAGYSLAGLFSLWCMSNSSLFSGCVSCSGSLWFPGWDEYMQTAAIRRSCAIYLSLGDREARTKDPDLSRVEAATAKQQQLLSKDPNVVENIFCMEPGGHFNDAPGRLERGIRWTVGKLKGNLYVR